MAGLGALNSYSSNGKPALSIAKLTLQYGQAQITVHQLVKTIINLCQTVLFI